MFEKMFGKYITAKNVVFFVILVLFLVFLSKVQDIAIMFFATYVLACSMEPLVQKLSKKYKRSTAAGIVLMGAIVLISIVFVPLLAVAGHEIGNFIESFPQYLSTIKGMIYDIHLPLIGKPDFSQIDIGGAITTASGMTTRVLSETLNIGKIIGSGFVYLLASLIIMYYFMADKDKVRGTMVRMFPTQMRERASEILNTISQKIGGYVVAQIATMAGVGLVMTIGLMILRVDYALLLGLITAILDIIPVVGPAIALVICLVVSYKSGWAILAGIGVVFAIAQLTENNFVRPYVFGKFLDVHPLIIYMFLFITAKYLGILGVVFAPAIAATAVVLIEEVYIKNIEEQQ
ncbi:AI-2E family transporter [bacterium]|nr:AI-2E family transporter [bacterium]